MVYIITSKTRDRMRRTDGAKLRAEAKAISRSFGVNQMIPLKGQDELKQLEELKNNENKIKEQMIESEERRAEASSLKRKEKASIKMNEDKLHDSMKRNRAKRNNQ